MSSKSIQFQDSGKESGAGYGAEDTLQRARPIPRISIQAFCEDAAVAEAVQTAAEDRRLSKAHSMASSKARSEISGLIRPLHARQSCRSRRRK